MKLEILIPTYNRDSYLSRNIEYLIRLIKTAVTEDIVKISISDNASSDHTENLMRNISPQCDGVTVSYCRQSENIGLEKNALYLLEHATAEYVMYLGDDDYIDEGYLSAVLDKLSGEPETSCVLPGILAFWDDGRSCIQRAASFDQQRYEPSLESCVTLTPLGHQLSGVVLRRHGLYESYQASPQYHNIYLFIYFVGKCALEGVVFYMPVFKTRVLQGNTKDWKYDDAGLLTEIAKNYRILFPDNVDAQVACEREIVRVSANWRLRANKISTLFRGWRFLRKSDYFNFVTFGFCLRLWVKNRAVGLRRKAKKLLMIIISKPFVIRCIFPVKRSLSILQNKRVFFILASGRTETMALSRILSFNQKQYVEHEPVRSKKKELFSAYKNQINLERYLRQYRLSYLAFKLHNESRLYGECHSCFQLHAPVLQNYLPNMKLIHMIRDGRKVVASTWASKIFTSEDLISDTINVTRGALNDLAWGKLTRFQKICLCWRYDNEFMRNNADRSIRYEDVIGSYDYFKNELCAYLDIQCDKIDWTLGFGEEFSKPHSDTTYPYNEWKDDDKRYFWNVCGDLMRDFNYEI